MWVTLNQLLYRDWEVEAGSFECTALWLSEKKVFLSSRLDTSLCRFRQRFFFRLHVSARGALCTFREHLHKLKKWLLLALKLGDLLHTGPKLEQKRYFIRWYEDAPLMTCKIWRKTLLNETEEHSLSQDEKNPICFSRPTFCLQNYRLNMNSSWVKL